jgi:hypothetical protein
MVDSIRGQVIFSRPDSSRILIHTVLRQWVLKKCFCGNCISRFFFIIQIISTVECLIGMKHEKRFRTDDTIVSPELIFIILF